MFSRRLDLAAAAATVAASAFLVLAACVADNKSATSGAAVAAGPAAAAVLLPGYDGWTAGSLRTGGIFHRQRFNVLVADSPERQERGLMFVKNLPSGVGMVFPQSPPQVVRMWMKNTLIPLDMLFLDANHRVIYICENAPVQSLDIITTDAEAVAVLEIAGGESARRGIRVGDQFTASGIAALK